MDIDDAINRTTSRLPSATSNQSASYSAIRRAVAGDVKAGSRLNGTHCASAIEKIGMAKGGTTFAPGTDDVDNNMVILAFAATVINAQDAFDDRPDYRDLLDLPE